MHVINQSKDDLESTVVPQRNPHAELPIDYNFDIIGSDNDYDDDGESFVLNNNQLDSPSFSPSPQPQVVPSVLSSRGPKHLQNSGLVDISEEQHLGGGEDDAFSIASQQQQFDEEEGGLIDMGQEDQAWLTNLQQQQQVDGDDVDDEEEGRPMTHEELQEEYKRKREEKSRLMAEYRMLRDMGYVGSDEPELTHSTSMEELTRVVERLRAQHELDESIKWQRQMLIMFTNTVEDVLEPDSKLNIFGLKLQGWSESVFNKIHDFDRIFEQLHYKYKSQYTSMPEIQLAKALLTSAYFYHTSQKLAQKRSASSSPQQRQFEEVMRQNPHLRQQYEAALHHMGSASMPQASSGAEHIVADIIHEQRPPVVQAPPPTMNGPMNNNVIDEIMAMPTQHPMSNDNGSDDYSDYEEDILDLSEEDGL